MYPGLNGNAGPECMETDSQPEDMGLMDETNEDGYLILTRRPNETLRIGDDILLHVVAVGSSVRISIEAPEDQRILRSELLSKAPRREADAVGPARAAETPETYQAPPVSAGKPAPVVRYRRRRRLSAEPAGAGRESSGGD